MRSREMCKHSVGEWETYLENGWHLNKAGELESLCYGLHMPHTHRVEIEHHIPHTEYIGNVKHSLTTISLYLLQRAQLSQ